MDAPSDEEHEPFWPSEIRLQLRGRMSMGDVLSPLVECVGVLEEWRSVLWEGGA